MVKKAGNNDLETLAKLAAMILGNYDKRKITIFFEI